MTRRVPLGDGVQHALDALARECCEGYSGADLAALVREAGVVALKRTLGALDAMDAEAGGEQRLAVLVEVDDFVVALEKVQPSVSVAQRRKYEGLRSKFVGLPVYGGRKDKQSEEA